MFSLTDDINKFSKQTFTLKDDTITIDQRFLGGGINMKDLIQENNFIITQMRKMKTVFLNYCKLNQKVYKTIMEHQISAADQVSKMNTLTSTIERKLQTTTKDFKKLKQQIIHQNHKNKQFVQSIVQNVLAKVNQKVDVESFAQKVKQLIQQYQDQSSYKVDQSSMRSRVSQNQLGSPQIIRPAKKKKGLTAQDIQVLKAQLVPLIEGVNQKVDKNEKTFVQKLSKIQVLQKVSKKHNNQINWSRQDIKKIENNLQKINEQRKQQDDKIIKQLRQKTNQRLLQIKFQNFNQNYVKRPIQKVQSTLHYKSQQLSDNISKIYPILQQLNQKIHQKTQQIKQVDNKFIQVYVNFQNIHQSQLNIKQQYTQMMQKNQNQIHHIQQQLSNQAKSSNLLLISQIIQLTQKLQNISKFVQQNVLKRVDSKIGVQMKQIRNDIFSLNQKTRQLKYNLISNGQQVTHVKDVVSKKANFTDLLHYIDKKADKKDFKQIQDYLSSPKAQRQQQDYQIKDLQPIQTMQKKRKTTSYSKMNSPYSKPEEYSAKNLFKCYQTQSKQIRKTKIRSIKGKKSGRPTTANTMFIL